MMVAVLGLLTFAGCLTVMMGMVRHYREMFGHKPSKVQQLWLRLSGTAVLTASVLGYVLKFGTAVGLITWLGVTSVVAIVLTFSMPYLRRR